LKKRMGVRTDSLKGLLQSTGGKIVGGVSKVTLSAALVTALSACAVGPDFKIPDAPGKAAGYSYLPATSAGVTIAAQTQADGMKKTAAAVGVAQTLVSGQDIPAQWWLVFQSEQLDQLIRSALAQSPSLASAQAALLQAQENYNAQAGTSLYPTVTGNLGAGRERASAVSTGIPGGSTFNLYNASVNVSYTLDVFGANQRGLEALRASVDYQRFQVEATYLSLTANLVTTAIKQASLRAQLQATEAILQALTTQMDVIERQFAVGAIPKSSVLSQRTLVAQTRASLPGLRKAVELNRHQLAVYAGQLPSDAELPEFTLDSLKIPTELPVSIPSALVRQRPDIRANEALLHAASASVGVAVANQYPQFSLTGSYGSASTQANQLGASAMGLWSLAAGVTQPIFNAGALSAKKRAAVAAYDQVAAQYQATVLTAFQNVADSLRALEFDATTLKQQVEVEAVARESLELTEHQFAIGAVSSLALLDAKRVYQTARISLIVAQEARYADTAALFQAMGGGWWNRPALSDISTKYGAAIDAKK